MPMPQPAPQPTPQQEPLEIEYSERGYILLPAEVARQYFPNDVLVLMVKGNEVWMLPTRGPVAGGLLLKQRNADGDRSLLAAPYLPPETSAERWPAFWDERSGALRVAFRIQKPVAQPQSEMEPEPVSKPEPPRKLEPAIAAKAIVEREQGRWVVYLDMGFSGADALAVRTERKRIADFATEERAKVAAGWIERTADRDFRLHAHNLGY